MITDVKKVGNSCKINHLYANIKSIYCEIMNASDERKKQLYEDALYYHLIHKGKKVIKNKYGLFWDKRKNIFKKDDEIQ